jgi:ring-1,2-phenylacetyl-CoA epoxidase subunit PaaA
MIRICREESFHQRQGFEIMLTLCRGTPGAEAHGAGRAEPLVVAVAHDVRPSDADSVHSAQSTRWKIKRVSNDELRQKFIDVTAPQAEFLGLTIPDPALRLDPATGSYAFGEIDWAEFNAVIAATGRANAERLAARRKAHADGAWVREAASAHAAKRRAREARAA